MEKSSEEIIEISDSEGENDTENASYRAARNCLATPYPSRNLIDNFNQRIADLNHELDVSNEELRKSVYYHLRFVIMMYTPLRSVMYAYDDAGMYCAI